MSPIGKVFIVLNLVLAGAFVGFAGTYLQRATDWKKQHSTVTEELAAERTRAEGELATLQEDLQTKDRELNKYVLLVQNSDTENKKLVDENKRLGTQLASLEGNLAKLQSAHTTISSAIDRATADSKQALEMAMTAKEERDAAKTAQETAEKQLADANFKIEELEGKVGEQLSKIGALDLAVAERDTIIGVWKTRYPGIGLPQPDLNGRVEVVSSSDLLTIAVENASVELKPGWSFAIYDGDNYKGDAVITGARDNMAFCKVKYRKDNATFNVGDRAATNLGF